MVINNYYLNYYRSSPKFPYPEGPTVALFPESNYCPCFNFKINTIIYASKRLKKCNNKLLEIEPKANKK